MSRTFDRSPGDVRPISFQRHFTENAPGSVIATFGRTMVLCTATAKNELPGWMVHERRVNKDTSQTGWLTADYGMLPASTSERRERRGPDGRATEIKRFVGRSLRAALDFGLMRNHSVAVDCHVLQADGGTRTAAISAAWVALYDLSSHMIDKRLWSEWPLVRQLAAVSVGIVNGEPMCDLDEVEDKSADVDMNIVMTDQGKLVETLGGAEGQVFDRAQLDQMLDLGEEGIKTIQRAQLDALGVTPGA